MTPPDHLAIDQFPAEVDRGARPTTWYAQGHADGLGDRLLMFDNTGGPSWEILRFTPALARHAPFEAAVRHRVDQLRSFQHPAFPLVRPVGDLGEGSGLAVVSTYVQGVSLSEVVKKPRTAEFTARLVRRLLVALATLHEHAPGVAHGALTADRLVLTADGRPAFREHMLGSALASLEFSTEQLWTAFGILTTPERQDVAPVGPAHDVVQVALLAISVLAGRRIGARDFGDNTRSLLDRIAQRHTSQGRDQFDSLRRWLEQALMLDGAPFESARSASEALPAGEDSDHHHTGSASPLPAREETASPPPRPANRTAIAPGTSARTSGDRRSGTVAGGRKRRRRRAPLLVWIAAAAGVVALAEAAFIGRLIHSAPATRDALELAGGRVAQESGTMAPIADSRRTAAEPAGIEILPPSIPSLADIVAPAVRRATEAPTLPEDMSAPAAASPRRGGFTVSSPIPLHVLSGDRLIGSSDEGPIIAAAGRHELEFVNSVIGYRMRHVVDVAAGRVTPVSIAVPNGRLNINAIPWAEVWIDGRPLGETPLGNVSLTPGEHEIVFRHPELGEHREQAVVRPDSLGRVAVNLRTQN